MALVEVKVPDIGDFKDVAIIEVLVKPGDSVKLEQSLVTVESDKASMEVPSGVAGVVEQMRVKLGDKINVGDVLLTLQTSGDAPPALVDAPVAAALPTSPMFPGPTAQVTASAQAPVATLAVATEPADQLSHASPSVRKYARELGVPLMQVQGSGPKGRITLEDVQSYTRSVMNGHGAPASSAAAGMNVQAWPKVDFAQFGPVERKDLSRIQKISGANLHRNWTLIPHVTNHDDADITELEALRLQLNKENEKAGVKVTMLAFLVKACVAALKEFPQFNASLDGEQLVFKRYFHIGFAADTPHGLMVPVLKDADQKGVLQISQELGELAAKARQGKLSPAEMTGGCLSISSLGGIGGRYFTPIINAPEVAILGVSKATLQPVWDGKAFAPRLMLPLSLSWDHRVIDGAAAARFNAYLGCILADFRRIVL